MWEEGACIYGTPGVLNNFPLSWIESFFKISIKYLILVKINGCPKGIGLGSYYVYNIFTTNYKW